MGIGVQAGAQKNKPLATNAKGYFNYLIYKWFALACLGSDGKNIF